MQGLVPFKPLCRGEVGGDGAGADDDSGGLHSAWDIGIGRLRMDAVAAAEPSRGLRAEGDAATVPWYSQTGRSASSLPSSCRLTIRAAPRPVPISPARSTGRAVAECASIAPYSRCVRVGPRRCVALMMNR